jgi:hypothetical protein
MAQTTRFYRVNTGVELLGVSRAAAVAIFDSAWRNQPIS